MAWFGREWLYTRISSSRRWVERAGPVAGHGAGWRGGLVVPGLARLPRGAARGHRLAARPLTRPLSF